MNPMRQGMPRGNPMHGAADANIRTFYLKIHSESRFTRRASLWYLLRSTAIHPKQRMTHTKMQLQMRLPAYGE